jgi:hypothetical protein
MAGVSSARDRHVTGIDDMSDWEDSSINGGEMCYR